MSNPGLKIYLAGKMGDPWRHTIVKGLEMAEREVRARKTDTDQLLWPVLRPYRAICVHGGENHHGVNGCCVVDDVITDLQQVKQCCLSAIDQCDMVFASYLNSKEPFGTVFELGYAEAKGKPVITWIESEEYPQDRTAWENHLWATDCWMALETIALSANRYAFGPNPAAALQRFLRENPTWIAVQKTGTPIEKMFMEGWHMTNSVALAFQHQVGKYFLDFAHVPTKTAIELDGFKGHSTPEDIEKDRVRQRWIEGQGWRFIRFGGREITQNATKCALETAAFIKKS